MQTGSNQNDEPLDTWFSTTMVDRFSPGHLIACRLCAPQLAGLSVSNNLSENHNEPAWAANPHLESLFIAAEMEPKVARLGG